MFCIAAVQTNQVSACSRWAVLTKGCLQHVLHSSTADKPCFCLQQMECAHESVLAARLGHMSTTATHVNSVQKMLQAPLDEHSTSATSRYLVSLQCCYEEYATGRIHDMSTSAASRNMVYLQCCYAELLHAPFYEHCTSATSRNMVYLQCCFAENAASTLL